MSSDSAPPKATAAPHAHHAHRAAPESIRVAVLSCSDSRTRDTDAGGALVAELARAAGFDVRSRDVVPDEVATIRAWVTRQTREADEGSRADVLLVTGGTSISGRDGTVEAITGLLEKELPGYGELFRALSYQEVGPAAMLSRATAGTIGTAVVFLMPGSPKGVRLAMEKLILPELPHIASELRRHRKPHGHEASTAG